MDNEEQRKYKRTLQRYRIWQQSEERQYEAKKEVNADYIDCTDRTLRIAGFHIQLTEYDEPIYRGFKRDTEAVETGKEKRLKSLEKKKEMNEELKEYTKKYAAATKEDKEAIQTLSEIKKKYEKSIRSRDDNIKRRVNKLKRKINANFDIWTHFISLTFGENLMEFDVAKAKLNDWFKTVRELYPDLAYTYVVEFQKRGSIHFHILCHLKFGLISKPDFGKLRATWKRGTIDIKGVKYKYQRKVPAKIKKEAEQHLEELALDEQVRMIWSVGSYLTSYLKKDADNVLLFGEKMYGSSEGLKEEITIRGTKKIDQILSQLGVDQLQQKEYVVEQKSSKKTWVDENGEIQTPKTRMYYYNKLIPKLENDNN